MLGKRKRVLIPIVRAHAQKYLHIPAISAKLKLGRGFASSLTFKNYSPLVLYYLYCSIDSNGIENLLAKIRPDTVRGLVTTLNDSAFTIISCGDRNGGAYSYIVVWSIVTPAACMIAFAPDVDCANKAPVSPRMMRGLPATPLQGSFAAVHSGRAFRYIPVVTIRFVFKIIAQYSC